MDDPIESSLGTLYVVTVISAFLLGCLVLQGYRYFTAYPDDSRWMKYLIAFVVLLELALQMTVMQVSYTMSITHAGDPLVLSHITSSQLEPALLLSVFAVPVHEILYYWRIYTLLGWKWVCIIATILSCGRTCGWIYYITRVTTLGLPAALADTSLRWLVIFLFALRYFLGASIVVILTLYLAQFRKTPGIGTRMLVQRLIMWTVSTSLIAMIPQLVSFILFIRMKGTLIWMCVVPINTKVFANCLLSMLNNREVTTGGDGQLEHSKGVGDSTTSAIPHFASISIRSSFSTIQSH